MTETTRAPRAAWSQWIGPETLIEQVRNTAPFLRLPAAEPGRLIELGLAPNGFLRILANWENMLRPELGYGEQLQDYFALCLACHHATVATFVPTDVDTKIRGIVWRETKDVDVLRPMLRLALASRTWTEDGISIRAVRGVSGHNGEQWSAIAGGLGRLLELGDTESAEEAQTAIEAEIDREQAVFDAVCSEKDAELDVLRLSMTLSHNRGDLSQGMGFWKRTPVIGPLMDHLSERGRFALAVKVYQHTGLSAEGHRHYPLRAVKALRRSEATLLPLCPFLDEWGGAVVKLEESHEVLAALVTGSQKVEGQQGYYRAMAGMRAASQSGFDRAAAHMPNAVQRGLKDAALRKLMDVPRGSFEAMMRKRARTALTLFPGESVTLLCPVRTCHLALARDGRRLVCAGGHSFDVARSGYVNLLQPQDKRSRQPGDTTAAVAGRRRLHDSGATAPLQEAIADVLKLSGGDTVLDAGCGEGFFPGTLAERSGCAVCGVDISVAAIEAAARRYPACEWIVANADRFVPYADGSFTVVQSITARMNAAEFRRVLREDGRLLVALPGPEDLIELRGEGRDRGARTVESFAADFRLVEQRRVTTAVELNAPLVQDVLHSIYRPGGSHKAVAQRVTLSLDLLLFRPHARIRI